MTSPPLTDTIHAMHNNPEVNLHLLNSLRHNFEMLNIFRTVDGSALRPAIGEEMKKFNDGLGILADGKFSEFTEWFIANTSPSTQEILSNAIGEGMASDLQSE